jgi:hypothetical protein
MRTAAPPPCALVDELRRGVSKLAFALQRRTNVDRLPRSMSCALRSKQAQAPSSRGLRRLEARLPRPLPVPSERSTGPLFFLGSRPHAAPADARTATPASPDSRTAWQTSLPSAPHRRLSGRRNACSALPPAVHLKQSRERGSRSAADSCDSPVPLPRMQRHPVVCLARAGCRGACCTVGETARGNARPQLAACSLRRSAPRPRREGPPRKGHDSTRGSDAAVRHAGAQNDGSFCLLATPPCVARRHRQRRPRAPRRVLLLARLASRTSSRRPARAACSPPVPALGKRSKLQPWRRVGSPARPAMWGTSAGAARLGGSTQIPAAASRAPRRPAPSTTARFEDKAPGPGTGALCRAVGAHRTAASALLPRA